MNSYDIFCTYVSLKNHFNNKSYDYFKYSGKSKTTVEQFEKRNDKYYFQKIRKKYGEDAKYFLLANFIHNNNFWVGEIESDEPHTIYTEWKKNFQSISYNFQTQISNELKLCATPEEKKLRFKHYIQCLHNRIPDIAAEYLRKNISIETFIIVADITRMMSKWDNHYEKDLIWEEISFRIKKYKPFLDYDREKFKKILLDILEN